MKKLTPYGQKWLKAFHLFFCGSWAGAAICLVLLTWFLRASDGMELYGIDLSKKFIDDYIIIPAAIGALLTGLLYSLLTNWDWFRHNWIIVKWCITLFGIIFGTFWLGPWLNTLLAISAKEGLVALSNPAYIHAKTMNQWCGIIQVATLVFALFISALKPWRGKNSA